MKKLLLSFMCSSVILGASAADDGVFYSEDFEWLEEWSVAEGVGKTVETDSLGAKATALTAIKRTVDGEEMTCFDYIEKQGYKFVYDKNDKKRTYLQRNYLKFGKTGNHSGLTLKSISNVPAGTATTLTFDWCPMRQGSGKLDPVTLYVKVAQDDYVEKFDVPTHGWENGHVLEWIRASVDLSGVDITADTRITITQNEWEVGTANRWFLDNIQLWDSAKLAAIGNVEVDEANENAPVEYYNLQGARLNGDNLPAGLYVRRQGTKVEKVLVK